MSTLFIGVILMARIDSDDWQVCIHLTIEIFKNWISKKKNFWRKIPSKNVSPLGTDVWPAIENIYTNLALLYRRYIHFFQSLKKVYSVNFLSLLYGMSLREENPKNLLKFYSCSRKFNGADVRTVHSRKFICWVHCVHSLIGIIILLQQLHLLYLIF